MAGTADDARLMVELAQWGAMMDFGEATGALFADDFDAESATLDDAAVRTVAYFYETVGTLVKHDLMNRELVLDWLWAAGAWDRVAPAARKVREELGEPRLFENFEALAQGQR